MNVTVQASCCSRMQQEAVLSHEDAKKREKNNMTQYSTEVLNAHSNIIKAYARRVVYLFWFCPFISCTRHKE